MMLVILIQMIVVAFVHLLLVFNFTKEDSDYKDIIMFTVQEDFVVGHGVNCPFPVCCQFQSSDYVVVKHIFAFQPRKEYHLGKCLDFCRPIMIRFREGEDF